MLVCSCLGVKKCHVAMKCIETINKLDALLRNNHVWTWKRIPEINPVVVYSDGLMEMWVGRSFIISDCRVRFLGVSSIRE